MLRKMLLSAVLVLLQDDPGNQTFALSLLSVGYLTIHSYVKPYSSMELNELETGTLFVTVLTLSLCTFTTAKKEKRVLTRSWKCH